MSDEEPVKRSGLGPVLLMIGLLCSLGAMLLSQRGVQMSQEAARRSLEIQQQQMEYQRQLQLQRQLEFQHRQEQLRRGW